MPSSSPTSSSSFQLLRAAYSSPANAPFTHIQTIPNPSSTTPKTAYLSSLRKAREVLQERINQELTARMEEDNMKANAAVKGEVDEGKEEENYGEEVVDEE